jgi:lipooligosaccharide transport system ATP-binding protein
MHRRQRVTPGAHRAALDARGPRAALPRRQHEQHASRLAGIGERQEVLPDRVLVYASDGEVALKEVHARELVPESTLVRRSSLEDVFLRLTGRSLVD